MVETNINKRWGQGLGHHPKSKEIFKAIKDNDWKYGDDCFCWKEGGDGDNGEHLMYLLDIHFEQEQEKADKEDELPNFKSEKLFNADPNCQHVVVARWSGVGCKKCSGWFRL